MNLPRGSISRGLHPTLRVPALEAAKVGNARRLSSYERQKQHRPRRSRNHCVHEFVVYFVADRGLRPDDDDFDAKVTVLSENWKHAVTVCVRVCANIPRPAPNEEE